MKEIQRSKEYNSRVFYLALPEIKSFISSLLSNQLQELKEKVEGMPDFDDKDFDPDALIIAKTIYRQALSDVIKFIIK